MRRDDVLRLITEHRAELADQGVKSLALFGSVARDEAGPDSDVDVLVELEPPAGYFALARLQRFLESILDCPVDVGTPGALTDSMRESIRQDMIHVA